MTFFRTALASAVLFVGLLQADPAAAIEPRDAHPQKSDLRLALAGLKLFASGQGFSVGRRSAGYHLQGGAALRLDEGVALTASYRLNGFSAGYRLDPDIGDVDARSGAPFLGLDFEF